MVAARLLSLLPFSGAQRGISASSFSVEGCPYQMPLGRLAGAHRLNYARIRLIYLIH